MDRKILSDNSNQSFLVQAYVAVRAEGTPGLSAHRCLQVDSFPINLSTSNPWLTQATVLAPVLEGRLGNQSTKQPT